MEFLDIVNEQDEVIGQASRQDIYNQKHRHRIVHVLIFNSQGEMALQLRSAQAPFMPGSWGTTVGGHVQSGETYEEAAARESREEIGVVLPVTPAVKLLYFAPNFGVYKFLQIFTAIHDGPLTPQSHEGDSVRFFSLPTIKAMIANDEKFMPELLFILQQTDFPSLFIS